MGSSEDVSQSLDRVMVIYGTDLPILGLMVTEKYIENLTKQITKHLGKVARGPPSFSSGGDETGQAKAVQEAGLFGKSGYQAQEYLLTKIPVDNSHFQDFYISLPILNIGNKSVSSVTTFAVSIPYQVPETFVEQVAAGLLSFRMVPHDMVFVDDVSARQVIKQKLITYPPINALNGDKKLRKLIHGKERAYVKVGLLGDDLVIKYDAIEYKTGMFTIVPFNNDTLLIAKDAGLSSAKGNSPRYDLFKRYQAMAGVAQLIAEQPQSGQEVGALYPDIPVAMFLHERYPHLEKIPWLAGTVPESQ